MRLLRTGLLVSFVLAGARPLSAAEPMAAGSHAEPTFSDRFFRGTSPGELPGPKVLVVSTLYAASLASIIVGVASLIRAGNHAETADTFKLDQPPGFCNALASAECREYRDLLSEERETRSTGFLLLGAGGLALLGGALTAELWPNESNAPRIALTVDGTGAGLSAQASF